MELSLLISSVVHRYDIEPLEPGKKVSAPLNLNSHQALTFLRHSIVAYCRRILAQAIGVQRRYEAQVDLGQERKAAMWRISGS
jgi:hypothetical protein